MTAYYYIIIIIVEFQIVADLFYVTFLHLLRLLFELILRLSFSGKFERLSSGLSGANVEAGTRWEPIKHGS